MLDPLSQYAAKRAAKNQQEPLGTAHIFEGYSAGNALIRRPDQADKTTAQLLTNASIEEGSAVAVVRPANGQTRVFSMPRRREEEPEELTDEPVEILLSTTIDTGENFDNPLQIAANERGIIFNTDPLSQTPTELHPWVDGIWNVSTNKATIQFNQTAYGIRQKSDIVYASDGQPIYTGQQAEVYAVIWSRRKNIKLKVIGDVNWGGNSAIAIHQIKLDERLNRNGLKDFILSGSHLTESPNEDLSDPSILSKLTYSENLLYEPVRWHIGPVYWQSWKNVNGGLEIESKQLMFEIGERLPNHPHLNTRVEDTWQINIRTPTIKLRADSPLVLRLTWEFSQPLTLVKIPDPLSFSIR